MSHPDSFDPVPRGRWTGRSTVAAMTALVVLLTRSSPLLAQVAAPAPTPPPTQTVVTRSLTLEIIVVVVMIGAALFAVCRSSRRN